MREYELVLMLDPGQDAPARDAVANEVKGQIEASGTLKHENVWGLRKLAYEIAQRNEADYRWFRFEAPTELLEQLDHNLKIADGVLRFRVFKVGPETPVMAPPASAVPGPGASRERPSEDAPQPAAAAAAVAAPAATEDATPAPEATPEPAPTEASPEPAASEPAPEAPAETAAAVEETAEPPAADSGDAAADPAE